MYAEKIIDICVTAYIYINDYIDNCLYVQKQSHTLTHTHTHIYIYIYIYMCVCVYVFVCVCVVGCDV